MAVRGKFPLTGEGLTPLERYIWDGDNEASSEVVILTGIQDAIPENWALVLGLPTTTEMHGAVLAGCTGQGFQPGLCAIAHFLRILAGSTRPQFLDNSRSNDR